MEELKQNVEALKSALSHVFANAVLIGAIGLAITDSLPGGLEGGEGFIIGFLSGFLLLSARAYLLTLRANKAIALVSEKESKIANCPE